MGQRIIMPHDHSQAEVTMVGSFDDQRELEELMKVHQMPVGNMGTPYGDSVGLVRIVQELMKRATSKDQFEVLEEFPEIRKVIKTNTLSPKVQLLEI